MMKVKIILFWDMTPCSLVGRYHHLKGNFCLHLQVPTKRVYLSTKLLVMTSGKTDLHSQCYETITALIEICHVTS
jgi:hypothetical protein